VARTWFAIEVELVGGRGLVCDPAPGRVMNVGPSHTFAQLAEAIDAAFARWDLSHPHEFELPGGRLVGYPDDSFEPDVVCHEHAKLKVVRELKPGMEFATCSTLGTTRGIAAGSRPRSSTPSKPMVSAVDGGAGLGVGVDP
jgi:hypothetical protein